MARGLRLLIFISAIFNSCTFKDENVITQLNLITSADYEGYIIVFYNQPKAKGEIEYRQGEHYIKVPDDGVILTKHKLGDISETSFLNSKEEKIEQRLNQYDGIEEGGACIGCWGGRGSMTDIQGKDIVVTFHKMGSKDKVKRMRFLYNSDLQDIYYGRKTGKIKYWMD